MQSNLISPTEESHLASPIQHATKHVEPHNVAFAVKFGILLVSGLCIPLGLAIGYDRTPGSLFAYGFSGFVWPMISALAIGVLIGGSLGYVMGHIAHASDPVPAPSEQSTSAVKSRKFNRPSFTIHLNRH